MTRIIHIGDVHLKSGHPRNAERLKALDQIIQEGLALEQLGGWLVPGDIFHERSSIADRNDAAERFLRMADAAPVAICRGNHDSPGDLDIFQHLRATWPIRVFTTPGVYEMPLATGETAAIAIVPYPDKAGLVSAGVAPGDVPQTATDLLDVIFMQLAADLGMASVGGALPLFMGHFNTRGAVVSSGQPQIGHEQEVDRMSLSRLPALYFALSHIHEPQEVGSGVYAGSIAPMDYGERTPRSYVRLEATRGTSWNVVWSRQPIDTPLMFHIDGVLTRSGFSVDSFDESNDDDIHRRLAAADWAGCDVRARARYQASERAALDFNSVKELFAGAYRLKVETVAQPDRDLRAPEVALAKTLEQKLAAFRREATLAPAIAQKLALLQQPDAAALVAADVQARLAAIAGIRHAERAA